MSRLIPLLILLVAAAPGGRLQAQPTIDEPVVIADRLLNPRHITQGSDGTLYIAEAGQGGTSPVVTPFMEFTAGLTSRVTAVDPSGHVSALVDGLVSIPGFGGYLGAHKALVDDEFIWLLLGQGINVRPTPFPDASASALLQLDRATRDTVRLIDVFALERAENPDGDPFSIASNPVDFAIAPDGTIYIADASANAVFVWTEHNGLSVFAAWPAEDGLSTVPSAVEVGPDGTLYVGFLGGFPYTPEETTARIEVWAGGEHLTTYRGVNLITDLFLADDGALYAVELAAGLGPEDLLPDSGRVVIVTEDGIIPVIEGLNYPYSMLIDDQDRLLVTVNSAGIRPLPGAVLAFVLRDLSSGDS